MALVLDTEPPGIDTEIIDLTTRSTMHERVSAKLVGHLIARQGPALAEYVREKLPQGASRPGLDVTVNDHNLSVALFNPADDSRLYFSQQVMGLETDDPTQRLALSVHTPEVEPSPEEMSYRQALGAMALVREAVRGADPFLQRSV